MIEIERKICEFKGFSWYFDWNLPQSNQKTLDSVKTEVSDAFACNFKEFFSILIAKTRKMSKKEQKTHGN